MSSTSAGLTDQVRADAAELAARYPKGRSALLPMLHLVQSAEGTVTSDGIALCAEVLDLTTAEVAAVATFYTMFQLSPVGKKAHVQVCGTTPCMLRGSEAIIEVCRSRIHHDPRHLSENGDFSWEEVECVGCCANAPVVQIGKDVWEDLTADLKPRDTRQ